MDEVLKDLPFYRCYIDDIVVWSRTMEEHLEHLETVFKRLHEAGFKVHPGKCVNSIVLLMFDVLIACLKMKVAQ